MVDIVIHFGQLSVYGASLLVMLTFLWGSFIFYKKATSANHQESLVLDLIVSILFWSFLMGRLIYVAVNWGIFSDHFSRVFFLKGYPGFSHWGLLISVFFSLWLVGKKFKYKFFDLADLVMLGVLGGLPIFYIGLTIFSFVWPSVVASLLALIVYFYAWNAEDSYRTYEWYRGNKNHARPGFLTGFALFGYGLILLVLLIWNKSFGVEFYLSLALIVIAKVLVYIRSGRSLREDINLITKYVKNFRKK